MEMFLTVIGALNVGFLQTLKLFVVTLIGALPLGLVISFGSMSPVYAASVADKDGCLDHSGARL